MSRLIARGRTRDYWDPGQNVRYPRCAVYEAYIAPARDVVADPPARWVWWAGESLDPLVGRDVDYTSASLRGYAATRADAERLAREALTEMEVRS